MHTPIDAKSRPTHNHPFSFPLERPPGIPDELWAQLQATRQHIEESTTHANPRVVVDAFVPDPSTAAGIELPEITVQTYFNLEKIKSPLIGSSDVSKLSLEDLIKTFFVISRPGREICALLRHPALFEEKLLAFSDTIRFRDLPELATRLGDHIKRAFSTGAETEEEGDGNEKKAFPATVPDGSSR